MKLLDLPVEIFDEILYWMIIAHGMKRGVRLRLVNRMFAAAIRRTVCTFRLLDAFLCLPRISKRILASPILEEYFEYRVLQEPAKGNPFICCIRQVAEEITNEQNLQSRKCVTLSTCIRELCRVSVDSPGGIATSLQEVLEREHDISNDEYLNHLLAAAIHANIVSTAQRCISESATILSETLERKRSSVFGSIASLAGKYGDEEILECLMTAGKATLNRRARTLFFISAAQAGRLRIVQFLYDFRKAEVPWRFGDKSCDDQYETEALSSALKTLDLDTLKFVEDLRAKYSKPPRLSISFLNVRLDVCAQAGIIDMVSYRLEQVENITTIDLLLQHGADPSVTIVAAASTGQTKKVKQLLNRGIVPTKALLEAASGPYFDIVRLLVDAGVDPNESIGRKSPLASAISLEHTVMFEYLMEHGADLHTPGTAEECLRYAQRDGLESMSQLLDEYGVHVAMVKDVKEKTLD